MKHPKKTSNKGAMSRGERVRAIRDAIDRRRTAPAPAPPPPLPASLSPITAGSTVSFHDARGRFVSGTVLDDESFQIKASNFLPPLTVLYKSPYMSWEESMRSVGGSTLIKPRDLLGFTRMLAEDLDLDQPGEESNLEGNDEGDSAVRRGA